jgi:hypothetical protein
VLKHPSHKQRATNATGVGNGACLAIPPTLPSKLHCDRTDDHVTVAAARRAPAAAPQSLPNPRAHSVAAPARLALDADSMLGSRAPDNPRGRLATMALRRLGIDSSSCSRSRAWAQYSTRCSALAQMIALAGVTLVAAAALAWHRYTLLLSLTYSGGARWRSTRTRCSAQGRLTALAGVTLAAAAVSAWSRYTPPLSLLCLGSAGCRSRRARRPHAITIALLTG